MEESIYNLVPRVPEAPQKAKMHRSKFDPRAPPSYSTFPRKEVGQGQGDGSASMLYAGRSGAMGRDVGPEVDPKRFLKAHSSKKDKLPPAQPFHRPHVAPTKPGVPTREDKPVMGLMTEKNFVHSNSVDAVCAPARHRGAKQEENPVARKDFGKPPEYLKRMKAQVDQEKTMLAEAHSREAEYHASMKEQFVRPVPEDEKEELIAALRVRWEEKHRQYHSLPFAQDTAMSIARKEAIERELKEIETALAKLSKKVVVVYNDKDGPAVARWAKQQAEVDANQTATRMVSDAIATKRGGSTR
eukprot:CAMPEP_0174849652 /NCGR_PEP_ID=MMETSP1114-20130205/16689_1 /TAXON_ID=312471 /ORGANISM="Neobodo designis, Strain CCAP 1951/1" /LENGTH=299 /DNA_ID=CAMNT_0016084033 /DNA_START=86 /DNA_END=985 /DNA_ORIENTATION=+